MSLNVGTNCYLSLADADSIVGDTLYSEQWLAATTADRERALITSTSTIDNEFRFVGVAVSPEQDLAWPREDGMYLESSGCYVSLEVGNSFLPKRLLRAVSLYAAYLLRNKEYFTSSVSDIEIGDLTVGPIEIKETSKTKTKVDSVPDDIRKLLAPLLDVSVTRRTWWRAN